MPIRIHAARSWGTTAARHRPSTGAASIAASLIQLAAAASAGDGENVRIRETTAAARAAPMRIHSAARSTAGRPAVTLGAHVVSEATSGAGDSGCCIAVVVISWASRRLAGPFGGVLLALGARTGQRHRRCY